MKAVIVSQAGGPEVLEVREVAKPQVKTGWSLVKIKGSGINHSEIFTRQGLSPSVVFPRILGIELVGVIEETTEPNRLPVGQKVVSIMGELGRAFDGGYAEYALVPNQILYPVQTDLGWAELASVPETYYTAYGSMKNLKLEASDRILVRAGLAGLDRPLSNWCGASFQTCLSTLLSASQKRPINCWPLVSAKSSSKKRGVCRRI